MKVIKDGGSIVNVCSATSNYGSIDVSACVSAKHALIGLTKVAAFEGAPRNILVNSLCPYVFISHLCNTKLTRWNSGAINTDIMQKPFNSAMGEFNMPTDKLPVTLKQ